MAGWEDLITVAMLGTDRRPLPDGLPSSWGSEVADTADPTHAILVAAARHQALARAGQQLTWIGTASRPTIEPEDLRPAPDLAYRQFVEWVLRDILRTNVWLEECVAQGCQVAARFWPELAASAARRSRRPRAGAAGSGSAAETVDRALLLAALGPAGRWFLDQNPAWRSLLQPLPEGNGSAPETVVEPVRDTDWVRRNLGEIMLADQLTAAGQLHRGRELGYLLLPEHYRLIGDALEWVADQPWPARRRSDTVTALLGVEEIAWLRIELRGIFRGRPPDQHRLEPDFP